MKFLFIVSYFLNVHLFRMTYIRVFPQGTFDNNLGPDRLADPKDLDPKYCRQPTL